MKIKVKKEIKNYEYLVTFVIDEISDEDILRISRLSPILIDFSPDILGINNYTWKLGNSGFIHGTRKLVILDTGDGINFEDLYNIEYTFKSEIDTDKYIENILEQFKRELQRLYGLNDIVKETEVYDINTEEGIKKIYEGAEKVLDKNSNDYKEIIERNRSAWKKLADL